jgi:hypothetical protein
MDCPLCSHPNAEELVQCERCSTPLPLSDQTIGPGHDGGWSVPAGSVVVSKAALKHLAPGAVIGERYEIIRLLGQGGMVPCTRRRTAN